MLSAALFAALCVSAQPEPMGPISPASLPPPPSNVPMHTRGPLGYGVNLSVGVWSGKKTISECREKALAAVAAHEGFRFAEINAAGHITGYTSSCRFFVYVTEGKDQIYVAVWAASRHVDAKDAVLIVERINRAEPDPTHATKAGERDVELERKLLPIHLHFESYAGHNVADRYVNLAKQYFKKQGFETSGTTNVVANFVKAWTIPQALRAFEKRQFKASIKGESWLHLIHLEQNGWQDDFANLVTLLSLPGPKDLLIIYISTSNAADHCVFPDDLKAIASAIAKIVFE